MNKELGECSLCNELYDAWAEAWSRQNQETESYSDCERKKGLLNLENDSDNNS